MLTFLIIAVLWILFMASVYFNIHGIILCFRKKWYIGVAALIVPGFATIVSVASLVFKKDLLSL